MGEADYDKDWAHSRLFPCGHGLPHPSPRGGHYWELQVLCKTGTCCRSASFSLRTCGSTSPSLQAPSSSCPPPLLPSDQSRLTFVPLAVSETLFLWNFSTWWQISHGETKDVESNPQLSWILNIECWHATCFVSFQKESVSHAVESSSWNSLSHSSWARSILIAFMFTILMHVICM